MQGIHVSFTPWFYYVHIRLHSNTVVSCTVLLSCADTESYLFCKRHPATINVAMPLYLTCILQCLPGGREGNA